MAGMSGSTLRAGAVALVALLSLDSGHAFAAPQAPRLPPREPLAPIFVPPAQQDISGVWQIRRYSAQIVPADGGALPFTPEGRARYQANQAALRTDPLAAD